MNDNYDKKMTIAFLSSFVLLIVAFFVLPRVLKRPTANVPVAAATNIASPAVSNTATQSTVPPVSVRFTQSVSATNVLVGYPETLELKIDTEGGRIAQAIMNGDWNRQGEPVVIESPTNTVPMGDFFFGNLENLRTIQERPVYRIAEMTSNSLTLTADATFNNASIRLTRTLTVSTNFTFQETISLQNKSRAPVQVQQDGKAFTVASTFQFSSRERVNNQNISMYRYFDGNRLNQVLKVGFLKAITGGRSTQETVLSPVWLADSDNYIVAVMKPATAGMTGRFVILFEEKNYREIAMGLEAEPFILNPGETRSYDFSYYVGPKKEDLMKGIDPTFRKLFAWNPVFNWLMKPIEWLITKGMFLISRVIKNYGLVIILLALIIKLLLSPLSIRAAVSMKRTQLMQPKLKNLQEKYKDDQQQLQQKTIELYRKEGINPLGGCWPMLLQIPVFFALYRVLSTSVELRGARFLWIKDLTQPDTLFTMNVPLLPHQFNLLPILMTLISLVQTYLQQGKSQVSMTGQKQSMLQVYMMPVMFLLLFWNMPAGLVLYWTIQNVYSIIEQEVINLDKKVQLK